MSGIINQKTVSPPSFMQELEDLPDVTGTAVVGSVPIFDTGTSKFNLASLVVDMTSVTNGMVLTWDAATGTAKWATP